MDERLRSLLQERLGIEAAEAVRNDDGWDSIVFDVDGDWIVRLPRRPEVRDWLRKEAALLPLLAPDLPVSIPAVVIVADEPGLFVAAHPKLQGRPLHSALSSGDEGALAHETGSFLAALHGSGAWLKAGLSRVTAGRWNQATRAFVVRCEAVLPMLSPEERRVAESMFAEHLTRQPDFELVLLHADLGPEHILCREGAVVGVIDWSDARMGDAALDLAWVLHGAGEPFAETLLEAYAAEGGKVDGSLRERALYFHRIGPWHEVLYGVETGRDDLVASGLAGVRKRLP